MSFEYDDPKVRIGPLSWFLGMGARGQKITIRRRQSMTPLLLGPHIGGCLDPNCELCELLECIATGWVVKRGGLWVHECAEGLCGCSAGSAS